MTLHTQYDDTDEMEELPLATVKRASLYSIVRLMNPVAAVRNQVDLFCSGLTNCTLSTCSGEQDRTEGN